MKAKSETRIPEARKKSESRKQTLASFSIQQNKSAEPETFGLQSSDFFRISDFGRRISSDSPSLKQFNSEF